MSVQTDKIEQLTINADKNSEGIKDLLITALQNMPYWLVIMVLGVGYYNERLINAYEQVCRFTR